MVSKDKLERINQLARKKKKEGLTLEEQAERKKLHEEYIQAVRDSLRLQLDSIHIVDDEMTEEEKENVAFLTEKLGKEFEEQQEEEQFQQTLQGNPSNPTGSNGALMLQRMNKSHKKETEWGFKMLPSINPKMILDIGCGGGAVIADLLKKYPDSTIYGIDISDIAVKETINFNREAVIHDRVRVSEGAAENLPYGDEFFDLVVSVNSFFFWSDFKSALKQIYRVSKKDATILLLGDVFKGVELTENEKKIDKTFGLKLLSAKELEAAFQTQGFKNIKVQTDEEKHWIGIVAQK